MERWLVISTTITKLFIEPSWFPLLKNKFLGLIVSFQIFDVYSFTSIEGLQLSWYKKIDIFSDNLRSLSPSQSTASNQLISYAIKMIQKQQYYLKYTSLKCGWNVKLFSFFLNCARQKRKKSSYLWLWASINRLHWLMQQLITK